jgi:5-methylcytosine-specific restriction endonuclease McrA
VAFILRTPESAGPPPERKAVEYGRCDHPRVEVRRRTQTNGVVVAVRQCLDCGSNRGATPKAGLDLASMTEWDDELSKAYWRSRSEKYDRQRADADAEWWAWYDSYLRSAAWRHRREAVLKRDNYVCRGCGVNRATHVHHLTYVRVGNELLFDLVSVCESCHGQCHGQG